MPQSSIDQEYWIAAYGLSRHIVLQQLQYFLGPSSSVRPFSWNGREGYLIKGGKLTKEQIEDLKRQSKEYERQQSIRMAGRSSTGDQNDTDINEPVPMNPGRRSPGYSPSRRYR